MAIDVITGKPIKTQFEGQRTNVDIDFDPAAWQEQWNLGEAGNVGAVEAQAIQSIKDALAQRYEGNEFYGATSDDIAASWAAYNDANAGTPGFQSYTPTDAELARTGDVRLQDEASRIFREQIMGGYNPNIDYRAENVTPNVFLRSGAGLGGWEGMGRPTVEQPGGVPLGYGVPKVPAAPPAPAPAPAPAAAPATGTRATTSTGQTAPAAPEVDPAIAQREIVTKALAARLQPIQAALAAGLIDIDAAQAAWGTARQEIYSDFLSEQLGVQTAFQTQADVDEAKRQAGRTKLLQDLNAAGVDSGTVADELALIDAITEASGDERMGLIGDIGRVGLMADADLRMMGEGIFGGQRQALRTDARQMGLEAELLAVDEGQTADERSLQAQALAPYMNVAPGALFADLYSDIDLTGMATGREEMAWGTGERLGSQTWQTGEREGAQTWQTGERIGGQDWQSAENVLDRTFATNEREAVQEFTTDERIASQDWAHDESIDQRNWEAAEAELGRDFTTSEREAIEAWNTLERTESQTWQAGESELDRAIAQQRADTEASSLAESIRQFGLGQQERGIDTREFVPTPSGHFVRNPQYGLPYGFDTATGLTAGQQTAADQFATSQAFTEKQFNELSAGDLASLTGQGIDMQETIRRQNPFTMVWETVANPNFGRQIGFDAATGLTAGETLDEAYRQDVLTADEAAAVQTQENWLDAFNQGVAEFDASQMGVDDREYLRVGEFGQNITVQNPTYGMNPMEQANYTLALRELELAEEAALQAGTTAVTPYGPVGEERPEDWLMREVMYHTWGGDDQRELTNKVLQAIKDRIGSNENVMGGGVTPVNVLWALGTLQADDKEFQPIYDAMLAKAQAELLAIDTTTAAPAAPATTAPAAPATTTPPAGVTPGTASRTFDSGAGNVSESEVSSADLIALIEEQQQREAAIAAPSNTGSFDWTNTWGADVGRYITADQSYETLSGKKYDHTAMKQIAERLPVGYTVEAYIDLQDDNDKEWGLKGDGTFGWKPKS